LTSFPVYFPTGYILFDFISGLFFYHQSVFYDGVLNCRAHLPVFQVNKVVDSKRIIRNKWRAKEEERHKRSLTPPPQKNEQLFQNWPSL
jgi:hypothetical protein